ncbi:hypothetical protein BT69DRAFT_1276686 [Atractiella rhizophila]|nr:hypothetical protein BT69DRAFT_1276686 [Atractiella rhizophila]
MLPIHNPSLGWTPQANLFIDGTSEIAREMTKNQDKAEKIALLVCYLSLIIMVILGNVNEYFRNRRLLAQQRQQDLLDTKKEA